MFLTPIHGLFKQSPFGDHLEAPEQNIGAVLGLILPLILPKMA